ncbi:MAG: hypothetical protein IPN93_10425 [Bacteroidetes bacterium]|nr:hypothetical protein [Bacteroidota bacterium]
MDEIEKILKINSLSLLINNKVIGSSVCLITETKLYFFTAKHCLVDPENNKKRYNSNSNISFERYYNNATYSLNETDTIFNSEKYDLSVIISRFVNAIPLITNKKVYSTNLTPYNTFFFKGFPNGYQVFDKTQGRLFRDLKYLEESDLDKNIITIKTAGDEDFLIIRSDFESNVKGISGSGVYFTNKKLPYLSHIVNSFQKVYKDLFITSLIPIIRELKLEIPIVEITEDFNDKDGVVKITEENQSSQIQTISAPIVNLPVKKVYLDIDGYMRRNLTDNINFQVNSFMSIFDKDSTFNSNTAIDILLENKESKFIILSDASFGKSIELKNIAAYFSKESEEIFPILVLLRDYNNENLQNFLERTYTNWKQIPLNRLLLLFDGLDELPDNKFNSIINEINTFSENNQEVKIVVSCRTNFYDAQVNQEIKRV